MRPTAVSQVVVAIGVSTAAISVVQAQSVLVGPVVNTTGAATVFISQSGASRLGDANQPVLLSGTGDFSLTVEQIGTSPTQASWIRSYSGAAAESTQITLKQGSADAEALAVNGVWAKILLGTVTPNTAPLDITLLQQGDGAQATIEVDNALKGVGANPVTVHWTQAAGATGSFISTSGNHLTAHISQAADTSVHIKNTGSGNTYHVATQLAGDSLALDIHGSSNTFNFNFPVSGSTNTNQAIVAALPAQATLPAYSNVSWGTDTPAVVNGGNFWVAVVPGNQLNTPHLQYVYDANNIPENQQAAAYATVTTRPQQ